MTSLKGKKALILGVANDRSIAWGIAQKLKSEGADVAFTYPNEAILKRLEPLSKEIKADFITKCDVSSDEDLVSLTKTVQEKWGQFDILVHSLAFAQKEDLEQDFIKTSRKGFLLACDISAYSLVGVCQHLEPLLKDRSSIITLSYYGSQKIIKNYNVMGVAKAALEASCRYLSLDLGKRKIRINCISAGAIKTLSACGIKDFREKLEKSKTMSPLQEGVDIEDIGKTALYLASDLSTRVTGQIIYVDAGMSNLARVEI
jgi:enoyl-[acyl-carrier protein] reductase I